MRIAKIPIEPNSMASSATITPFLRRPTAGGSLAESRNLHTDHRVAIMGPALQR